MRFLMLVLAAAVLSMGQRCPTEPSPCSQTPRPDLTLADLDRAYETGVTAGRQTCPAAPEPEPCPLCDVTTNDDKVREDAVDSFMSDILRECSFGPSVVASGDIDREVKRRIQNLHQYGYCR